MSAAGLTLSWSGLAVASRDESNAPGQNLGLAPASEQGCQSELPYRWVSCPVGNGDLARTLVANAAHLPLPLPDQGASSETKRALRLERVRTPGEHVERANHDDALAAMAWVLFDDEQAIAELSDSPRKPTLASSAVKQVAAAPVDGGQAIAPLERASAAVEPAAANDDAYRASVPADSASLERVLNSLAAVLGAESEDPGPAQAAAVSVEPALATPAPTTTASAETVPQPTLQATAAAASAAADSAIERSQRAAEADAIVVAPSHSDKVLMSLAAVRSSDVAGAGQESTAKDKPVVTRHTDKVLESLALIQAEPASRDAATSASLAAVASTSVEANDVAKQISAADEELARLGLGLDIDLDALAADEVASNEATTHAARTPQVPIDSSELEPRVGGALGSDLVALGRTQLDDVRGGFVADGLKISFGIERAVYLNGTLVTTTSLNIADLAKISGGHAQVTGNGIGSIGLVQSGAGNHFLPGVISTSAGGLVIQNTVDNQKINTITRIDAVVNSASILRSMNLQSSMRSAITDSLRR